jgi:hypothetical protein
MSTASQVLFVISGLLLFWQIVLVVLATNLIRRGHYTQVHISMWPGLLGTAAIIAGILLK